MSNFSLSGDTDGGKRRVLIKIVHIYFPPVAIVFSDASKSYIYVYIAAGTQIVESQSLLCGLIFSLTFNALIPSFPLKEDFFLWSNSKILIQSKDLELFFSYRNKNRK